MSTVVVYPDSGSGGTTVDGTARRDTGGETWASLHDSTGTIASTISTQEGANIAAWVISNQWASITRCLFTFDTSFIGSQPIISAVLSLSSANANNTALGDMLVHICSSTPANANNVVTADYQQFGSVSFSSVLISAFPTSGYYDFTLNASGISNINTTGISKFGIRLNADIINVAPTWVSGVASGIAYNTSDTAGTTSDPKLTVIFGTPPVIPNYDNFPPYKISR